MVVLIQGVHTKLTYLYWQSYASTLISLVEEFGPYTYLTRMGLVVETLECLCHHSTTLREPLTR